MKQTILMTIAVATALVAGGAARAASTTTVPVADWGAMIAVSGTYPTDNLFYAFTATPDQPLTITATFIPSGHVPGARDPGAVSPGWINVQRACSPCAYDGTVVFDMAKRYGWDFKSTDTMITIGAGGGGADEGVDYVPGATYTTTMTWNRLASTIDITVAGAGINYSKTVSSYGDTISGLVFHGPNDPTMGSSLFGNVAVITQAVPEPGTWLLLAAGLGAVGFKARRLAAGAVRAAGQA